MKKIEPKDNYESWDGNFYRLEDKDISDPRIKENSFRYIHHWWLGVGDLFFDLVKIPNDSGAIPILRTGKDSLNCPYCGSQDCVIDGQLFLKQKGNLKTSFVHEYGDARKVKLVDRWICRCSHPEFRKEYNLFLIEFVQHNDKEIRVEDIVKKRHCLKCSARWEKLDFNVMTTEKDGIQQLVIIVLCFVCGEIVQGIYPLGDKKDLPRNKKAILDWIKK